MSLIICPVCGAEHTPDEETCRVCQASLVGGETVSADNPLDHTEEKDGFLPHAEGDLPDLLRSLKQDGDLGDDDSEKDADLTSSPADLLGEQEEIDSEPDLPEWLYRVRQRAQSEVDSVGEITQRLKAAQESLDDEIKLGQQRQFESLIEKIHGEDEPATPERSQPEEQADDESREGEEAQAEWLTRIRKKHQPAQPEEPGERISNQQGDSLLQWLVALEEGSADAEEETDALQDRSDGIEDTQEVVLADVKKDSTQEIPVGKTQPGKHKPRPLSVSRAEQHRADQLSATIIDEKAPRPVRAAVSKGYSRWFRLMMAVVLMAVLSFALFFMEPAESESGHHHPHSLAGLDWVNQLPAEASLLIVMDYQAGFSAEMQIIAGPILERIWQEEPMVSVLYSTPSGSLLFDQLIEHVGVSGNLEVRDLGYYPVGSFGAYGLARQVAPSWQFIVQPVFSKGLPAEPFAGILILGDDYEGSLAWVEQFSSLSPNTPVLLLVSAQAGPLLLPYYESGQVVGILSGIADVANIDAEGVALGSRWRAYRVGLVMMIIVLLIGMSFTEDQRFKDGGST